MYLWKAWHDSRTRVVVYILAALSVGVLSGLNVVSWANWRAPRVPARLNWNFYMVVTFYALNGVIAYGKVAALLVGLSMGAGGVGREYGAGTMHFVLTRPGARRNLVFTDWTIGLTAILVVVGGLAFGTLPFLCLVDARGPGNVLIGLPGLWARGAAIYGLASFTTLVAGSAPRGLVLSVAAVLTYVALPGALHEWWHVDTLLRARDWTLQIISGDSGHFYWSVVAFWLAVAAGFLGASVAWIRYREV